MAAKGLGCGGRGGLGKPHCVRDFALDRGVDRSAPPGRQHGADALHLVVLEPWIEIGTRAIAGVEVLARADMLAPAIGAAFDENQPLPAAQLPARPCRTLPQLQDVPIIDLVSRDTICRDPLA